jgi:hypothetical protein
LSRDAFRDIDAIERIAGKRNAATAVSAPIDAASMKA